MDINETHLVTGELSENDVRDNALAQGALFCPSGESSVSSFPYNQQHVQQSSRGTTAAPRQHCMSRFSETHSSQTMDSKVPFDSSNATMDTAVRS
ncbi:hypothetical protein SprV_0100263000 [Sparganum proliferum]